MALETAVVDEAAALWAQGLGVGAIAAKLGKSGGSVSALAARNRDKFPARRTGLGDIMARTKARAQQAAEMHRAGASRMDIARHFDVTHHAVKAWLKKHDIAPRPRKLSQYDFEAVRDELSKAWRAGENILALAHRHGMTKGMLIGYAARNRDAFPTRRDVVTSRTGALTVRTTRAASTKPAAAPSQTGAALITHGFQLSGKSENGKPLWDLTHKCCRWPVNAAQPGETHLFCGEAIGPDHKSYCASHAAFGRTSVVQAKADFAASMNRNTKKHSMLLARTTGGK